jgi:hypothetical protein
VGTSPLRALAAAQRGGRDGLQVYIRHVGEQVCGFGPHEDTRAQVPNTVADKTAAERTLLASLVR